MTLRGGLDYDVDARTRVSLEARYNEFDFRDRSYETFDETIGGIVTRVDLTAFTLPVLLANDQESAAHEEVLKQLDKASGGKTVWRINPSAVA